MEKSNGIGWLLLLIPIGGVVRGLNSAFGIAWQRQLDEGDSLDSRLVIRATNFLSEDTP